MLMLVMGGEGKRRALGLYWWLDSAARRELTLKRLPFPAPAGLRTDLEEKQTEVVRIPTEARSVWSQLNFLLKC